MVDEAKVLADGYLARYRAIFESAVDFAIIASDCDGLITDWNSGAEAIFGWSAEEMLGQSAHRFFTLDDREEGRVEREMSRALEVGRGKDERWHLRKKGACFWANGEMMPLRDSDGAHIGFLKIVRDETEKRENAERRRIDQDFLESVLAASDDCIKVLDLDANLVFMSEGGKRVMEVDDFAAIRGCSWPDFWKGDLNAQAREAVAVAKAGAAGHFQGRTNTLKGMPRWWDVRVTPIPGADGRPEKILAISRDITLERRAANKLAALLDLSDRLRDCATMPDTAFAAAEVLGRTLEVERAGYASVDLARETLTIERDWTVVGVRSLVGTHRLQDYGPYVDVLKKGQTVVLADTAHHPRPLGRREALAATSATALVTVPTLENGGLSTLCFVAQSAPRDWKDQDVDFVREIAARTQAAILRSRAERALKELAASLDWEVAQRTADCNRLWQLSTDIMLVAGFDGIITAVNPSWDVTLGWIEPDLLSHSLFDLVHPDDLEHTMAGARALSEGTPLARFENRYRHKDGSYRAISWTAVPGDGLINAVGRDVTGDKEKAEALRTAEEQLRQSQKMEAVGQLTGGVAHDFNNLLTVIRSSIDLLKKPGLPEERRQRYIAAISDTTARASKLTGQLLAFSRRQALKPEVFDVVAGVRTIRDMVRTLTGSRIQIEVKVPDAACLVEADPSQFDTSVVNLVVNARDAMDGEGRLAIAVRTVARIPPLRAHPAILGDFVAISVTDTGSGIDPFNLDRIFEPFFTTKGVGQGTGLGLSQVFGFVKQSGGEVGVESELGTGTSFTLYLPVTYRHLAATQHSGDDSQVDGRGTRVLVVEDNPDVGSFTTQTLGELGYLPVMVSDAAQALDVLSRDVTDFDVVFSDVVMPGMNGIDLGLEVRRRYPTLPVVLTSGYSHIIAENGTHGFQLLQKPYSIEQLSRALQKARRAAAL